MPNWRFHIYVLWKTYINKSNIIMLHTWNSRWQIQYYINAQFIIYKWFLSPWQPIQMTFENHIFSRISLSFLCCNSFQHSLNKFWSSQKIILFNFQSIGIKILRIYFQDEFRRIWEKRQGVRPHFRWFCRNGQYFWLGWLGCQKTRHFMGVNLRPSKLPHILFFDLKKFKSLKKVLVKCM